MTQITRLFDSSQDASTAADELKARGFFSFRFGKTPSQNDKRGGDAVRALTDAGYSTQEAERYAQALNGGGAVLSVEAAFGRGALAEQILDRQGSRPAPSVPTEQDKSATRRTTGPAGDGADSKAAPLSSLLHLPVLTRSRPTTVSSLGDQRPTFPGNLLSSDFYLSRLFGLPLLTQSQTWASLIDNPAPLSSWLGIPVLLTGSGHRPAEQHSEPPDPDT